MIRLLILVLLGFLAYTLFTAVTRKLGGGPSSSSDAKGPKGEQMVQDPQCGTFLPRSEALTKVVRGEKHHFCSEKCRDAFVRKK